MKEFAERVIDEHKEAAALAAEMEQKAALNAQAEEDSDGDIIEEEEDEEGAGAGGGGGSAVDVLGGVASQDRDGGDGASSGSSSSGPCSYAEIELLDEHPDPAEQFFIYNSTKRVWYQYLAPLEVRDGVEEWAVSQPHLEFIRVEDVKSREVPEQEVTIESIQAEQAEEPARFRN